jgi:ATP-dependent 26S proteasome regulatory subunit
VSFFLNNKRWYEEKGVPYTLGLLLHGVPGAGKTSTIKSIAKDTNRHILNIRLTKNTTITQLNNLFFSSQVHVVQDGVNKIFDIPIDKRIIVLEDVDCLTDVVLDREHKEKSFVATDKYCNQQLNLSTILNILDGVLEQPGRILVMTSNHPEKLDKALLRPGRIDVVVRFERCKKHEVKELIEALADKHVSIEDTDKFIDNEYTPAEVSQIVFECIEDYSSMISRLSQQKPHQLLELSTTSHSNNEDTTFPSTKVENTQDNDFCCFPVSGISGRSLHDTFYASFNSYS